MNGCAATSPPTATKAMTIRARLAAALALLAWPAVAQDAPCRDMVFDGTPYVICEVAAGADLRVFHTGPDGTPYRSFARIETALAAEGMKLAFAMNAGMYHADRSPVGLTIENGIERAGIVTREGPGNFGMLPNGVFCVTPDRRFAVIESRAFARDRPDCRHATQSGPMLVIDGALHPRFLVDSASRYHRNGVGVSADGARAVLAITARPVNFHSFARLFRDGLGLPQALFLDGQVSRLYAPAIRRNDFGLPMGPVVGLVVPAGG